MKNLSLVLWTTCCLSGAALGQAGDAPSNAKEKASPASYSCVMGKMTRTVAVAYSGSEGKAPCKVNYVKDATVKEGAAKEGAGEPKVLFSADKEVGYCEKKAAEFVEKLKSTGWTCS